MPDVVQPAMHGRDHCPGGSDPIPCLQGVCIRATYVPAGGLTIATATETFINFDTWENESAVVFGETLSGGDLQKISLLQIGVYSINAGILWDTQFTAATAICILDDSSASSAFAVHPNMMSASPISEGGSQFTYPHTFSCMRKYPLLGVTLADVTAGALGRISMKVEQRSGSSKDLDRAWMEIYFQGSTLESAPLS